MTHPSAGANRASSVPISNVTNESKVASIQPEIFCAMSTTTTYGNMNTKFRAKRIRNIIVEDWLVGCR